MAKLKTFKNLVFFHIIFLSTYGFTSNVDRTVESVRIQSQNNNDIVISSISLNYMQELYKALSQSQSIPFRYPDDGCFARAHKTALLLEDIGIISAKSFIIGDLRLYTNDSPMGFVNWWYHVAAIVHVKDLNEVMVFDPTSSSIPLTKANWIKKLTSHKYGSVDDTFETKRFLYRPEDAQSGLELDSYQKVDILYMQDALDTFSDHLEQRQLFNLKLNVS